MSSVTFGSVGDIITVCLLAKSIVEALDDSRGSTAEYQGLITEIRSLECSLLELELFTRSGRDSTTPASLQRECSKLVTECRKTLESFQAYLKKYDSSLSKDTRTGIIRRAGAKIKWQLLAKDTVARFRSELAGHSNALNMMMITANVMVSLRGLDTQKASASSTERSLADQDEVLATLRNEIQNNSALASSMTSVVRTMSQKFQWFTSLLVSVKSMLSQGFRLNLATYRAVLSIQESVSHSMDRTLIQDPFVLEDPLGRVAPVHLQFITSWKAFYAVLSTRFEGLPGHDKIKQREFVIQERATNREISAKEPWEIAFRPGASVLMSLVFQRDVKKAESKSHCPYCGNISEGETVDDVNCMKCGMIYRRVTEITEIDQPTIPSLPNHWNQRPLFGRSGFNDQPPVMGPFLKRKRFMESWEELSLSEAVRSFKRVKILSNVKRARKEGFASWEDKSSWTIPESEGINIGVCGDGFGAKSTSTAGVMAGSRNLLPESVVLSGASFFPRDEGVPLGKKRLTHMPALNHEHFVDPEEIPRRSSLSPNIITSENILFLEPYRDFSSEELRLADYTQRRLYGNGPVDGRGSYHFDITSIMWRRRVIEDILIWRARLLLHLPGGSILAPISGSMCQILDIGPKHAWPIVAIQQKLDAKIQSVEMSDGQSSTELLNCLGRYGTEQCDLIHMQDWTVAANFLYSLPQELYRILRPGGWIEIEILELRMPHNSSVQLQIYPVLIRQGFRSVGLKRFSTAEGIIELLEHASFIHAQSTAERIPISGLTGDSDQEDLGSFFTELWLLALELIEEVANAFSEPQRSSRLAMIGEIRAALFGNSDSLKHSMDIVRIRAQKPDG